MEKDWTGNSRSAHATLGARNYAQNEREVNDYYAIEIIGEGHKVAMFLKIQFLEGKGRRTLFEKYPPKTIYVSSGRLRCAMNGDFERYAKSNAICYAWYVWQKGYDGGTIIKWIN